MILKKIISSIFFGNYFYGICICALAIESSLQQGLHLNSILFYTILFLGTIYYYTIAYQSSNYLNFNNPRTKWYFNNKKIIAVTQLIYLITCITIACFLLIQNWKLIKETDFKTILLSLLFPMVAILYYGVDNNFFQKIKLRNIGWLKPFTIGFVWSGAVTIYPVIYYNIIHQTPYVFSSITGYLFVKNFMFITLLCIMFDFKDYIDDSNQKLKTFVVQYGLYFTIYFILIPLIILGLGTFLVYSIKHQFSLGRIILNCIPFLTLLIVAYSLQKKKSILFYLIIIDGLMLLKAICGILGVVYFS